MNQRTRKAKKLQGMNRISQFGVDLTNLPINLPISRNHSFSDLSHQKQYPIFQSTPFIHEQIYHKQILHYLTTNVCASEKMDIEENRIINGQKNEINRETRFILVEWVNIIHSKFNFKPDTLFLAIHIIDSFCFSYQVKKCDYQLVGFTALFIAGKYQEVDTPCIKQFIQLSDKLYSIQQILKMQSIMLEKLNFDLLYESPLWYLKYFSYSLQLYPIYINFCTYLLQISLLKINSKTYHPFLLTLAIIIETKQQEKGLNIKTKQFLQQLGINRREIKEVRQEVKEIIKKRKHPMFNEINNKYKQGKTQFDE